jgi:hypothetical protein
LPKVNPTDEIRLKIWVMTFKQQHVGIDIQKLWELYTPEYRREGEKPMRPIFPASLHVNHESRTETLRYYCILPRTEPRTGPSAHHPVCLNPSLDSCYLSLTLASHVTFNKFYTAWLSNLDSEAPGGLKTCRKSKLVKYGGI